MRLTLLGIHFNACPDWSVFAANACPAIGQFFAAGVPTVQRTGGSQGEFYCEVS
jgi:hypothetical protein